MTGFRDKMWLIIAVFLAVSLITGSSSPLNQAGPTAAG